MSLSKKQKAIFAFPDSPYSVLICDGAIRSGKTIWMITAFVDDGMRRFNGHRFGICGKTVDSACKNIVEAYLATEIYKDFGFSVKWRRGEKTLVVTRGNVTNLFEIFGGKDESSYTLIQGRTLAGLLLDEVALMPRSFVEQATARCSVTGSKIWFNCNPAGRQHWFNQEWVLQASERNAMHLHFTMDDNPSLSAEIRQRYESMYSGVFYDRYILGLWVAAEGKIYDMFDPAVNVCKAQPQTDGLLYVSGDFGIQNATTFLLWGWQGGAWVILREYYYSGREQRRQKTVRELVDDFKAWLGGAYPQRVIIDPSAAALDIELRRAQFATTGADNDVLNGIADVSTMLRQGTLKIDEGCKNTLREIDGYSWDDKAPGIDRPIKEDDHCMDAVRYFVRTMRLVKRMG